MARFVQIIEFDSSRIDDIRALGEKMRDERAGDQTLGPTRLIATEDRDRPGHYLNIVEFESYDAAMRNSNDPATTEFAQRMAELCDAPPRFYNLDVMETWTNP